MAWPLAWPAAAVGACWPAVRSLAFRPAVRRPLAFWPSLRESSSSPGRPLARPLATSPPAARQALPPRPPPPPEDEIDEVFVKGTGPGGQKILRHRPTGIVVKSQATRSRSQNRAIARGLLALRLDELRNGAASRTAAVAAAKVKKRANATKKARRKYRRLAGDKTDEADEGVDGVDGVDSVDGEGGVDTGENAGIRTHKNMEK